MIERIRNKFTELLNDPHMSEVARGTAIAFVLKVIGAGLSFGYNVAVARLLGAEGAGLYFLALSVTAIGSVIGRVGLDNVLLRNVAAYAAHEEWDKAKGVYALATRMAIAASAAVTIIVFLAATWMASELFNKPALAEPLRWMSLSILPFAMLNLQAESLKGLKRIRDAMLVQGVGLPLVSLLLIYPLTQLDSVLGVFWAYSIGATMVALLGMFAWSRAIAVQTTSSTSIPVKELWESAKPFFIVSLTGHAILPFAPVLLLGVWASSDEVGVYGAASRVAMLVSLMLATINNVIAPKFAELYARGAMDELGSTARRSALLISLIASPVFLVLIFGGPWIMRMFGAEFEGGALVLAILVVGQAVNLMTGSVGYLLMMSGNADSMQRITSGTAIVLILACLSLIPLWGDIGAAIATALSMAGMNIASVWMVQRKLGIHAVNWLPVRNN